MDSADILAIGLIVSVLGLGARSFLRAVRDGMSDPTGTKGFRLGGPHEVVVILTPGLTYRGYLSVTPDELSLQLSYWFRHKTIRLKLRDIKKVTPSERPQGFTVECVDGARYPIGILKSDHTIPLLEALGGILPAPPAAVTPSLIPTVGVVGSDAMTTASRLLCPRCGRELTSRPMGAGAYGAVAGSAVALALYGPVNALVTTDRLLSLLASLSAGFWVWEVVNRRFRTLRCAACRRNVTHPPS